MADHYVHRLQTSMPLATAETIVDGALKAGADAGLLPLTVAVLDVGGHIVLLKRQDGSGNLRADIAIGKAAGALGMGISSRTIRDRLKDRPAFQSAIAGSRGEGALDRASTVSTEIFANPAAVSSSRILSVSK